MAGRIVQIGSASGASIVRVWVRLVVSISEIICSARELIIKQLLRYYHGKYNSFSIIVDVASWKPSWNGYSIKIYEGSTYNLTLTKLCKFY